MSLDLESLSAEPLIYMLMHSGAFVTVLGLVFFVVGLLFGFATWGRFKRKTRLLLSEAAAMKAEIADLKRKVGEQSVRSGPVVSMATETIHMPRTAGPAIQDEPVPPQPAPPASPGGITAPPAAPEFRSNVIKPKTPALPAAARIEDAPPAAPAAAPAAEPPAPGAHVSPLAAIKTSPPRVQESPAGVVPPPDLIPILPEFPEPAPAPAGLVDDPRLGPIYPSKPEQCDDLTALKGIAGVLEQRLNAIGIYTWSQIAGWNDEQIREVSSRLAFKDRIQRERWVEQARSLLEAKS